VLHKDVGENLGIVSKRGGRSPDELHFFVIHSLILVLIIESSEEPGIESHISEESGIGVRMAKRIDLPAYSGFDSEFFFEELKAIHVVVEHVVVDRASLVMHRPASIDHLKLSVFNQLPDVVLHLIRLFVPPHGEELHFNLRELPLWIIKQSINN